MRHVPGAAGCDSNLPGTALGSVLIDKDAFATQHSGKATADLGFHLHIGRHGSHGGRLDFQRLIGGNLYGEVSVIRFALNAELMFVLAGGGVGFDIAGRSCDWFGGDHRGYVCCCGGTSEFANRHPLFAAFNAGRFIRAQGSISNQVFYLLEGIGTVYLSISSDHNVHNAGLLKLLVL